MRNVPKLLDRARDLCSPPTDYQLAKKLGVSPQRVSNWRRQDSAPDNEAAWKLAHMLGMTLGDVIAYIEEDKAKTPEKRAWWTAQLPRLLSALAIAIAVSSNAIGGELSAERSLSKAGTISPAIYYAKYISRLARQIMRHLAASLKTTTRSLPLASAAA